MGEAVLFTDNGLPYQEGPEDTTEVWAGGYDRHLCGLWETAV